MITVSHARKAFGDFVALDDVSLDIPTGSLTALLGPSGSGKSTLLRAIAGLDDLDSGVVMIGGADVTRVVPQKRGIGFVFQHYAAFKHMTVRDNIAFGLSIRRRPKAEIQRRVDELLQVVGLEVFQSRYPAQLSGGQRQRIGLARALVLRPKFIVADEPVSALDVSIQSQVLNLLVELKQEFSLTYLFVAHDLAVVGYISDRVAVMYLGKIVELATSEELFRRPLHPYTLALLSANPEPIPGRKHQRIVLEGDVPSPINPPSGCRFRTRCPIAREICAEVEPPLEDHGAGHAAACHFAGTPLPETGSLIG